MICPQCQTFNLPENKFCRECGAVLPLAASPAAVVSAVAVPVMPSEDPRLTAPEEQTLLAVSGLAAATVDAATVQAEQVQMQERAAHLLAEAASLQQRGWLADATARAEKAAALLPGAVAPLSLLVNLYEAQGDRDKALATEEKIVKANPDLPSERDRLARLREEARQARLLAAEVREGRPTAQLLRKSPRREDRADKPLPYLPLAVAGGIAALVFCVGVSLLGRKGNTPTITETTLPAYSSAPLATAPSAIGANADPNLAARPAFPSPEVRTDPFVRQSPFGGGSAQNPAFTPPSPTARRTTTASGTRPGAGPRPGTLPLPQTLSAPGQVGGPVRFVPPAPVTVGNVPSGSERIIARPPEPTANNGSEAGSAPPVAPEDPGYIRIQVRPAPNAPNPPAPPEGGENGSGGANGVSSGSTDSDTNLSALSRARRLQDQGQYTEAIAAYRQAIALTPMRSGDAYQGLAQSYQRVGDASAARSGYQSAIRSYETQLSAGQRTPLASRGIEACRAALEVLGG